MSEEETSTPQVIFHKLVHDNIHFRTIWQSRLRMHWNFLRFVVVWVFFSFCLLTSHRARTLNKARPFRLLQRTATIFSLAWRKKRIRCKVSLCLRCWLTFVASCGACSWSKCPSAPGTASAACSTICPFGSIRCCHCAHCACRCLPCRFTCSAAVYSCVSSCVIWTACRRVQICRRNQRSTISVRGCWCATSNDLWTRLQGIFGSPARSRWSTRCSGNAISPRVWPNLKAKTSHGN